jgi:prepilin-type N-terminal cleavage/methylation domain-containing protein
MPTQNGFTLLELIMVMLITSIMIVMGISFSGHTINIHAQAIQLAQDIRYIQQESMAKNIRYRINFSSTDYNFTDQTGTTYLNFPGSIIHSISLPTGMTLSTNNIPNNYLVFDGRGTPYTDSATPGTPLGTSATLTLTFDGNTKTLTVLTNTGSVNLS